jgi:hypothetical protein
MGALREPSGDEPERQRARLAAGTVVLIALLALGVAAAIHAATPAPTTGTHRSATAGGVTVSLEVDADVLRSGATVSGHVVVVNSSGHDIGRGGPGSCAGQAFVVNLDDGHGDRTDNGLAVTCRSGYRFPTGTTNDEVRVPAVDGAGRPLPAGSYRAVLTVGPAYPLPRPAPVPLTLRNP